MQRFDQADFRQRCPRGRRQAFQSDLRVHRTQSRYGARKLVTIPDVLRELNGTLRTATPPAVRRSSRPGRRKTEDAPQSRFVTQRSHLNIQKDDIYSVVPRMWDGLITPDELRATANVAEKYAPHLKLEKMLFGMWRPHKVKLAASGNPRNCAESNVSGAYGLRLGEGEMPDRALQASCVPLCIHRKRKTAEHWTHAGCASRWMRALQVCANDVKEPENRCVREFVRL